MKKNLIALIVSSLAFSSVDAHDFEVDGIYYNLINPVKNYVEVTYAGKYDEMAPSYFGKVVIPSTVYFNNTSYTVSEIGEDCFNDCSEMTAIQLPETLTAINVAAFYDCSGLISVSIPKSVSYIGELAFDGCAQLTSIKIPESVSYIGYGAFADCTLLTSIKIPSKIKNIEGNTFAGCNKLADIYCYCLTPPSLDTIGIGLNHDCNIHVFDKVLEAYKSSEWNQFNLIGDLDECSAVAIIRDDTSEDSIEYYDLKGILVKEPAHGLYIRKQGSSCKLILK